MIDLKGLRRAVEELAEEKKLPVDKIMEVIESSLAAAYKREYRKKTEVVKCKFDSKTGAMQFWQVKTVVDPAQIRMEGEEQKEGEEKIVYNEDRHIFLEDAKKIKPDAQLDEELVFPLETFEDFGRIAAQTAKQVILQKVKEAEKDILYEEFKDKEGELVSGAIQRFEHGHIYIDLGKALGIMFANESVPGEIYTPGKRMRFYVMAVQKETRYPGVVLSRAHPDFVKKVFEAEVPEIADGFIEIKDIVREPGSRTKVAVISNNPEIDAVGSCIGQRGARIMTVSNELNERVDVMEWSEDPAKYISNALSPAKVTNVEVLPKKEARVYVPDDQLSLAIGKGGQNVRLAAKITGWRIDVRSQEKPEEALEGGMAASEEVESTTTSEITGETTTESKE